MICWNVFFFFFLSCVLWCGRTLNLTLLLPKTWCGFFFFFFFFVLNVWSFDSYFMNVRPTNLEASEVFLVARVSCICLCRCSTVVFFFFFIHFLGTIWACLLVALSPFYYCMKIMEIFFFLLMQYFFLCLYYIVRCNVVCFLHNSDFIWWQLVWIIVLALFQIVLHFVFYLERVAKLFEEWGKGEMWKKLKDYQDFLSLSLFFFY